MNCEICKKEFEPKYRTQRFCSLSCANSRPRVYLSMRNYKGPRTRKYRAREFVPLTVKGNIVLIHLGGGITATVDVADIELASTYNWRVLKIRGTPRYARAFIDGDDAVLHRVILRLPKRDGRLVDHRDGDGFNNRRSNLRIATPSQNQHNRTGWKNAESVFKGVRRQGSRWSAKITCGSVAKYLGSFATEREAALAYDAAAIQEHGEFAKLNFGQAPSLVMAH